ncbi:hypothetical protein [Sphingosinicella microcystinivorans]|uniref:hypothetical protein n=1 Tax=Sphingosinicella microcystinivorans TaxID=335406 RepID=UPI00300E48D2
MRMLRRIGRLFRITNGFEAGVIVYALGLGAAMRGNAYLEAYPGAFGWALYAACLLAVLMAGAALVDGVHAASPELAAERRLLRVTRAARGPRG